LHLNVSSRNIPSSLNSTIANPMLDNFDFSGLSEDPKRAFLVMEERLRERMYKDMPHPEDPSGDSISPAAAYVASVLGIRDELELNVLSDWPPKYREIASESMVNFIAEVEYVRMRFAIGPGQQDRRYSVGLDPKTKDDIRIHLAKIKFLIEASDLDDRKKEALYARIADLEGEVDRNRTKFQALAALIIEIAGVGGEVAEKLEPARKWVDSIAKLIGAAKSHEDAQPQLPRIPETKKIEAPKRQPFEPTSARTSDLLDEDVPF
jgi:hypothetical protein